MKILIGEETPQVKTTTQQGSQQGQRGGPQRFLDIH
jgi:hypothetical protein